MALSLMIVKENTVRYHKISLSKEFTADIIMTPSENSSLIFE